MKKGLIVCTFVFVVYLITSFNIKNGIYYLTLQESSSHLYVKTRNERLVDLFSIEDSVLKNSLKLVLSGKGCFFAQITVTRKRNTIFQKLVGNIIPSKINIFEFDPDVYDFSIEYRELFKPSRAKWFIKNQDLCFAINANPFSNDFQPKGLIIKNEEIINPPENNFRGYFIINNYPLVSYYRTPSSLIGKTKDAIQVGPSLVRNHNILPYITRINDNKYKYELKSRSAVGIKNNGNIVFINSDNGAFMNLFEISLIAQKLGIKNATCLDGGRALQYYLKIKNVHYGFFAFNNTIPFPGMFKTLRQISPVFIGVRYKQSISVNTPESISQK